MRSFIRQSLLYLLLVLGMALVGALLVPAGGLVMLAALLYKGLDKAIRRLEGKGGRRKKERETQGTQGTQETREMREIWGTQETQETRETEQPRERRD